MEGEKPHDSKLIDEVRNMSISRRGGVRTRGGRLPPITIRDFPKVSISSTSSKKVIAPKIPQRRKLIKKDVCEGSTPLTRKEPKSNKEENTQRKGRNQRVLLQTEGTFLAVGPAPKAKREPIADPCYSTSQCTVSAFATGSSKVDEETIRDLLSDYEAYGAYEDDLGITPPNRLPLLKDGLIVKVRADTTKVNRRPVAIKIEPTEVKAVTAEVNGVQIKSEPSKSEPADAKFEPIKIKSESVDESEVKAEGVLLQKVDVDEKALSEIEKDIKNNIEEFCNTKDEGMLVLLHWPNYLPWSRDQNDDEEVKIVPNKPKDVTEAPSSIDKIPEGKIGKLQFMKSGKKRLVIGEHAFAFEEGTVSETSKEVVSIRTTDTGGDLAVMGKIDRTMIIRPIVGNVLKKKEYL